MGWMSKDREHLARKGYAIPDDYHLRLVDDVKHVFEFQKGATVIRVDTSKCWAPPFNIFSAERTTLEVVPEKLINPGSQNYLMMKALREYANSISFTCKLCEKKHVSPGVGDNGVALFPSETMESAKDKEQKHFIQCKECPPVPKKKAPAPPPAVGEDPPKLEQKQLVVTKVS